MKANHDACSQKSFNIQIKNFTIKFSEAKKTAGSQS